MTGPEHYLAAERLLADVPTPEKVAEAQAHATLALASATAMNGYDETGMHKTDYQQWERAASCTLNGD